MPPALSVIPTETNPLAADVPPGMVDLHAHLLPGIDDGCRDVEDSLECIAMLREWGYVGTACTPHVWGRQFPHISPETIRDYVAALRRELAARGVEYRLWTGGELRICPEAVDYMKAYGVPTLGDSRHVVMDLFGGWSKHIERTADWLLGEGYVPVLAHPERSAGTSNPRDKYFAKIDALRRRGMLLQGNLRSVAGGEGGVPRRLAERWLEADAYAYFALDLHKPETLDERLVGHTTLRRRWGAELAERLTVDAPRRVLLGHPA